MIKRILLLALVMISCSCTSPIGPSGTTREYHTAGVKHIKLDEYEKAKYCLIQAVAQEPENPAIQYAMGYTHLRLGEYCKALEAFSLSLQQASGSTKIGVQALYGKAFVLDILGEYESAVAIYRKVLEYNPGSTEALYNRGCSYGKLDKNEKATSDFRRVLAKQPNHQGAKNNLYYYEKGV